MECGDDLSSVAPEGAKEEVTALGPAERAGADKML